MLNLSQSRFLKYNGNVKVSSCSNFQPCNAALCNFTAIISVFFLSVSFEIKRFEHRCYVYIYFDHRQWPSYECCNYLYGLLMQVETNTDCYNDMVILIFTCKWKKKWLNPACLYCWDCSCFEIMIPTLWKKCPGYWFRSRGWCHKRISMVKWRLGVAADLCQTWLSLMLSEAALL